MGVKITGREHFNSIIEENNIRKVDVFETMGVTSAYFFRLLNDGAKFQKNIRSVNLALNLILLRKTFGFIDLLIGTNGVERSIYEDSLKRASELSDNFNYTLESVSSNKFTFSKDGNLSFDIFVEPSTNEVVSVESSGIDDVGLVCKMKSVVGDTKYVFRGFKLSSFLSFFYYEVGGQVFINTKNFMQ